MLEIPDHLTEPRCTSVRHGSGLVSELANAYVKNLACDKIKTDQLQAIREYSNDVKRGINE